MSEAIIKTGNATLDRKVETAEAAVIKMTDGYDTQKQNILKKIFRAAIGFRVAEYLKIDEQKKRYAQKIDDLYALLPSIGLDEEKVADMVRKITGIIAY